LRNLTGPIANAGSRCAAIARIALAREVLLSRRFAGLYNPSVGVVRLGRSLV
jgi:hypothetical protein